MHRSLIFPILIVFLWIGTTSCGGHDKPPRPASDSTPPVVSLLDPVDGQEMIGPRSFPFQARATDDTGVTRVEFLFDGVVLGQDTTGSDDLYEYTWQNSPISAGRHRAAARAHDAAGNSSDAVATVTISPADTTRPVVTLLQPVDGQEMIGPRSFPFQARATDDTGVTRVEFLFDSVVVGQDSTATEELYDYTWQNSPIAAGQHHATARAHDAAGNRTDAAATITITARK
jgi:hypothetical protein